MSPEPTSLALAREIADAVLYEGYLLYPYRASSAKNRTRFQFGVLGPPAAAETGFGEPPSMSMQCLVAGLDPADLARSSLVVHLRFLQVQERQLYAAGGRPVERLTVGGHDELSWEEAVEREVVVPLSLADLVAGRDPLTTPFKVAGGEDAEQLSGDDGARIGRAVRRRGAVQGELSASAVPDGRSATLRLTVRNTTAGPYGAGDPGDPDGKQAAQQLSMVGAHLLVEADGCSFLSVVDPPPEAAALAASCRQDRCWPFLAGPPGSSDLVLGSPIILYDHPEVAPESAGALFDSTEIDEILTLRVMTMTDEEKAEARATDPRAREIIDRCEAMTASDLQQLHGVFRDPHLADETGDTPWWDPASDASVRPEEDSVVVAGVRVAKGSLVRVHPGRRADAQDLFFADQVARVTAVLSDVDGGTHVALVLVDDPAADLHEWYGRYFYFSPDEIEPLHPTSREESRP